LRIDNQRIDLGQRAVNLKKDLDQIAKDTNGFFLMERFGQNTKNQGDVYFKFIRWVY
jgi:hypothetical protein